MPFTFALILVIPSFYLLWALFVVSPPVLVDVGVRCLFEMYLSFLGQSVLLRTSLSGLPSLCHISFGLLFVRYHLFAETF